MPSRKTHRAFDACSDQSPRAPHSLVRQPGSFSLCLSLSVSLLCALTGADVGNSVTAIWLSSSGLLRSYVCCMAIVLSSFCATCLVHQLPHPNITYKVHRCRHGLRFHAYQSRVVIGTPQPPSSRRHVTRKKAPREGSATYFESGGGLSERRSRFLSRFGLRLERRSRSRSRSRSRPRLLDRLLLLCRLRLGGLLLYLPIPALETSLAWILDFTRNWFN